MLSYMVPSIEDKPPPAPKSTSGTRFQLELENQRLTNGQALVNGTDMLVSADTGVKGARTLKGKVLSTESSASSISSADLAPTHAGEKPKPKLVSNGGTKHQNLKRVSFGSSKGSMVETLIYESPVQEEPEVSPTPECAENESDSKQNPSKVRVTFFEQEKPLVVSSPEPELIEELDVPFLLSMSSANPAADHVAPYHRQTSTDSGWDNPFRPDGDLSREADEIVELIKGGKPITPTPGSAAPALPSVEGTVNSTSQPGVQASSPVKGANGSTPKPSSPPGAVELQRATVAPSDASQVEHVVLKKKPKCKCCVIQ